uniref:Uncharacterized protein n=1 Tax=Heterorhabditis bacteriophora TaxID=37862 RepID=A0A1I7WMM7_HETBA
MPSKSTSPTCAELEKLHAAKNVIGVLNHSKFACQDCAKKRLYNKFDGEELLFKTALPPWLIPPPSEQISDQPIKAVDKKKRNIPAKGKPIICPEDVDEHLYKRSYELSDSALIYEITKLKHVDNVPICFHGVLNLNTYFLEEKHRSVIFTYLWKQSYGERNVLI